MVFVRPIAANEWRLYRNLRLRALRESPDTFASTYEREATRSDDDWEARVSAVATFTSAQAFLAFQHAEPCGLVRCKASEAEPAVVEVFQMWVDPVSRGTGAGRALLARAVAWAEGRGAQRIRLGVTIADTPAMRLYRSNGFCDIGLPEPLRQGSSLSSQSMELNLCLRSGTDSPAQ
ncbi:GNAT family N-acetyltransferase [Pseudomonas sp. 13159349]|nr:GNAT family N-acetyltransferase [Pseudomonas sp. 13159349]